MLNARPDELARRLDDDLWVLDTLHLGESQVVASYLIEGTAGLTLVDVGPASTAPTLLAGIRVAGHDPAEVRHIVLTHIHLDHAGATGTLLAHMPRAHVYVHPLGAPHLVDPTKLITSAARIYGDNMERWWGTVLPVAAERIETLTDGARISAGSRMLVALHTPGHAVHHIAYHDERGRALFPGDAAGVRIEGTSYIRPPTPPPDLNLEDWSASLERMRRLPLARLYLPHFGVVEDLESHWEQLRGRLFEWGEFVLARLRRGLTTDEIALALASHEDPVIERIGREMPAGEALRSRYEHATNYRMTVQGYERYYRTMRPEQLVS
jgi:glyoxylase-like metal-dependent hydrolase (beta-lactamase superfamily II)